MIYKASAIKKARLTGFYIMRYNLKY